MDGRVGFFGQTPILNRGFKLMTSLSDYERQSFESETHFQVENLWKAWPFSSVPRRRPTDKQLFITPPKLVSPTFATA